MTETDRWIMAVAGGQWLDAARSALAIARRKNARAAAWSWAENAQDALAELGINVNLGPISWPDLETIEKAIKEAARA